MHSIARQKCQGNVCACMNRANQSMIATWRRANTSPTYCQTGKSKSSSSSTVLQGGPKQHGHVVQSLASQPFMGTLKPQSNGPLYSNTVIGTLAVDGRAVTFGTARRGLGGLRPAQSPPRCTKCSSPPINDQCTNFIIFDAALEVVPLHSKGLTKISKNCLLVLFFGLFLLQ